MEIRLQKVLAQAGISSRRKAEELITAGRVEVNGQIVRELGTRVDPAKDLVRVDGRLVTERQPRVYYVLYKPSGVVTTFSDPQGRPTIRDFVSSIPERVFAVGRLDYDAEGALVITNDGDLAHKLMHPSFEVPRTYLVKVKGTPDEATLEKLRSGVRLEDGMAKPLHVEIHTQAERNTWLMLTVAEGRPHLVKRLVEAVGHPALRLYRPEYGGITAEGMRPGQLRQFTRAEVESIHRVADGKETVELPSTPYRLPPRRHGHGDEEGGGEWSRTPSTPRPRRTGPRESIGERGKTVWKRREAGEERTGRAPAGARTPRRGEGRGEERAYGARKPRPEGSRAGGRPSRSGAPSRRGAAEGRGFERSGTGREAGGRPGRAPAGRPTGGRPSGARPGGSRAGGPARKSGPGARKSSGGKPGPGGGRGRGGKRKP